MSEGDVRHMLQMGRQFPTDDENRTGRPTVVSDELSGEFPQISEFFMK